MNIEMIRKYKDEFDYWIDGGELIYFQEYCNRWIEMGNRYFDSIFWNWVDGEYLKIVKNDKFSEYRIALLEGKAIQVSVNGLEGFIDYNKDKMGDFVEHNKYRIKPKPNTRRPMPSANC